MYLVCYFKNDIENINLNLCFTTNGAIMVMHLIKYLSSVTVNVTEFKVRCDCGHHVKLINSLCDKILAVILKF